VRIRNLRNLGRRGVKEREHAEDGGHGQEQVAGFSNPSMEPHVSSSCRKRTTGPSRFLGSWWKKPLMLG
jgi:hypothetical protein